MRRVRWRCFVEALAAADGVGRVRWRCYGEALVAASACSCSIGKAGA